MSELLSRPELLIAFISASLILAVTPGPSVMYIVARSATHGRRAGLASVAGIAVGGWLNAIAAAVGLGAIFLASSSAFTIVKWVGAAYLIFLGIQIVRRPASDEKKKVSNEIRVKSVFRDGFIVALLNPKTTIFFAAFLPQFMTNDSSPMGQALLLSTLCILLATVTDTLYAILASSASGWLSHSVLAKRFGRWLSGGVFVGLGFYTAVSGDRRAVANP